MMTAKSCTGCRHYMPAGKQWGACLASRPLADQPREQRMQWHGNGSNCPKHAAPVMTAEQIATAARHFIIAAIWADKPEGTDPRATVEATRKAESIVRRFAALMGPERWARVLECDDYGAHPDAGSPAAALGHDLFLTLAGHGAGFHDRDALPDDLREELDALCDWQGPIGEVATQFYRGWLYLSGAVPRALMLKGVA